MRKSTVYLFSLFLLALLTAVMLAHAAVRERAEQASLLRQAEAVKDLQLTDLCIFTEARYTRHPSQADRHAAFQDHPLSMEHFPSGSLIEMPDGLRKRNADLD
jgi:hypothetical protein